MLDHSYRVLTGDCPESMTIWAPSHEGMPITTTFRRESGDSVIRREGGDSVFSGEHIWKVTPVPIPNTVVKLPEPMVVPQARE